MLLLNLNVKAEKLEFADGIVAVRALDARDGDEIVVPVVALVAVVLVTPVVAVGVAVVLATAPTVTTQRTATMAITTASTLRPLRCPPFSGMTFSPPAPPP